MKCSQISIGHLSGCYLTMCFFPGYVHSNGLNHLNQQTETSFCSHAWSSTSICSIYRDLLFMEAILHQFMVVCPINYKILYILGGAGFLPSTVGIFLDSLHALLFCLLFGQRSSYSCHPMMFHAPFLHLKTMNKMGHKKQLQSKCNMRKNCSSTRHIDTSKFSYQWNILQFMPWKSKTKQFVAGRLRILHGFRIPDPTGQSLTWTSWVWTNYFLPSILNMRPIDP